MTESKKGQCPSCGTWGIEDARATVERKKQHDEKLAVPYEVWRAMKRVVAASMSVEKRFLAVGGVVVDEDAFNGLWKMIEEYEKAIR